MKPALLPIEPPATKAAAARSLRADMRAAYNDLDRTFSHVEGLISRLEELGGPPEQPEATNTGAYGEGETFEDVATEWLHRQRLLGLISAEGIAAVEKLIAEVG